MPNTQNQDFIENTAVFTNKVPKTLQTTMLNAQLKCNAYIIMQYMRQPAYAPHLDPQSGVSSVMTTGSLKERHMEAYYVIRVLNSFNFARKGSISLVAESVVDYSCDQEL
jgi:hypothetical protein